MRIKYDLEYTLNCSPKVLFSRLSTPGGLGEWFADDVQVDGENFTFHWGKTESKARACSLLRKTDLSDLNGTMMKEIRKPDFFEFKIIVHDITGDLALLITDFAEPDEKEDAIYLWDAQINDLKKLLGS